MPRTFFFFFFEELSLFGLAAGAAWACAPLVLSAPAADWELLPELELEGAASFTCGGAFSGAFAASLAAAGCKSFPSSGIAVMFVFPEVAAAPVAPGGASERGIGAFSGAGAPLSTRSTETLLAPLRLLKLLITLLLTARTMSGALACLGSTRVGSPTLAASETFGPLRKFSITLSILPVDPRLAISALSSAIAWGVACGTGCFRATSRFLASAARSSRG